MQYSFYDEFTNKTIKLGITGLIDNGYSVGSFEDTVASFSEFISYVKFGWLISVVDPNLKEKIKILNSFDIDFCFGGSLAEKCIASDRLDIFDNMLEKYSPSYIEISNGTVSMDLEYKARFIEKYCKDFKVLSEVGSKDLEVSNKMSPRRWIEEISHDLEAGAYKVITEAREEGTGGMCRDGGELRFGLIEEIIECLNTDDIIFEAPNTEMQGYFINSIGSGVNLSNIPFSSVLNLHTLRVGYRSETFSIHSEGENKDEKSK